MHTKRNPAAKAISTSTTPAHLLPERILVTVTPLEERRYFGGDTRSTGEYQHKETRDHNRPFDTCSFCTLLKHKDSNGYLYPPLRC
jgi:hypothetical protein